MSGVYTADVTLGGLVRKDSIAELVRHRDRALELARKALETLVEAEQEANRAAPLDDYAGFIDAVFKNGGYGLRCIAKGEEHPRGLDRFEEEMKIATKAIDARAWGSLVKLSGLRNLMDCQAHERTHKELNDKPPAFTEDNIAATFMQLSADAPQIFERSVLEIFKRVDNTHYKTNSAFRIGPKVILTYACESNYGGGGRLRYSSYAGNGQALFSDLDRVFHILDGKKPPEAGNFADLCNHVLGTRETVVTSDYFQARFFLGNGNCHLKFLRMDLVNKANDIIARQYGKTLPDDRRAA